MKRTFTKKVRRKWGGAMISGGWGRHGPYVYSGVRSRRGTSIGVSVGTKGRQLYASHKIRKTKIHARYNIDTKRVRIRTKLSMRRRRW